MLKFFRRIRHKLLAEGKLRRYLIYAIGEIILVVIGILIAVQINNWNENRKDATYEQKILTEINTSLVKDLERTNQLLNEDLSSKEQAIKRLLEVVTFNRTEYDTFALRNDLTSARKTIYFTYDKGPYESLKALGLDRISNDSLRNNLVRLYEVSLPLSLKFLENRKDDQEAKRSAYFESIVDYRLIKEIDTDTTLFVVKMTDLITLQTNPDFLRLIDLEERVNRIYRTGLEKIKSDIEQMMIVINNELNK